MGSDKSGFMVDDAKMVVIHSSLQQVSCGPMLPALA